MSAAPGPWYSVVWEGYEGPEGVVERNVYPDGGGVSSDRDLAECSETDVLLPDRETHSAKRAEREGAGSETPSSFPQRDVEEEGGNRLLGDECGALTNSHTFPFTPTVETHGLCGFLQLLSEVSFRESGERRTPRVALRSRAQQFSSPARREGSDHAAGGRTHGTPPSPLPRKLQVCAALSLRPRRVDVNLPYPFLCARSTPALVFPRSLFGSLSEPVRQASSTND